MNEILSEYGAQSKEDCVKRIVALMIERRFDYDCKFPDPNQIELFLDGAALVGEPELIRLYGQAHFDEYYKRLDPTEETWDKVTNEDIYNLNFKI